jgi:hypothetical protein
MKGMAAGLEYDRDRFFGWVERKKVIDKKYQSLVFAFFMALLMSCIMSFVVSVFNVGLVNDIVHIWLKAWGFAFIVAFPTVTLVAPVVRKLTGLVLRS